MGIAFPAMFREGGWGGGGEDATVGDLETGNWGLGIVQASGAIPVGDDEGTKERKLSLLFSLSLSTLPFPQHPHRHFYNLTLYMGNSERVARTEGQILNLKIHLLGVVYLPS